MPARHVSYSELSTYRQCPYKHLLSYRERWKPAEDAPALNKGRLFHEVLAAHYQALQHGENHLQAAHAVIDACADEELHDLIEWMYDGYLDTYGADEKWTILAVERKDLFPLLTGSGHRSHIYLKTVIDLLVADEVGRVWLVDHKTASDFPSEVSLDLDDQFSLYQWGLAQRGQHIHGIIYNCCRTRRNKSPMTADQRFRRIPLYRTQAQLANTALDAWQTARRMTAGPFVERSMDSDRCTWRCPYTEACLFGRKGGRIEEFLIAKGYVRGNGHGQEGDEAA